MSEEILADIASVFILISLIFFYLFVFLQFRLLYRIFYLICLLIIIPFIPLLDFAMFHDLGELYQFLSHFNLSKYEFLAIVTFLGLGFICCYKIIKDILYGDDRSNGVISSRSLKFIRVFGYCSASSILLFSNFFKYVYNHPSEKIATFGIFKLYAMLFLLFAIILIFCFLTYLSAVMFIYVTDYFDINKDSTFYEYLRHCFLYMYPNGRKIMKLYNNGHGLSIKSISSQVFINQSNVKIIIHKINKHNKKRPKKN